MNEIIATDKAQAPFLALAHSLVFEPSVKQAFNKNPRKVLEAFAIPKEEIEEYFLGNNENFMTDKIKLEIDKQSTPNFIIPHHEVFRQTPVLNLVYTLLHNGTISDAYQPNGGEYRNKLFEVFGLNIEDDVKVLDALKLHRPGNEVILASIKAELDEMVRLCFLGVSEAEENMESNIA